MSIKGSYSAARPSFNNEDAEMLHLSEDFQNDRSRLKKQFKIPELTSKTDIVVIPVEKDGKTAELVESVWANSLNQAHSQAHTSPKNARVESFT